MRLGIFLLLFLIATIAFSQDNRVTILEEKQGKRLLIKAQNTTQDSLSVFLRIVANGYRRSADKPILKIVPPNTTIVMTTLIAINDVPSRYTYDLIVNENLDTQVDLSYKPSVISIKDQIGGRLLLFTKNSCQKCELLGTLLTGQRIQHQTFNIDEDPVLYQQLMKLLGEPTQNNQKIRFPVIWNKDHTIFGYDDLNEILNKLQ